MRTHSDPWASQSDREARQHYDETHDLDGNRTLGGIPSPTTEARWRAYASDAMYEHARGRLPLAEAMGRVVNVARQLSRQRVSETELHDDAEHASEGE